MMSQDKRNFEVFTQPGFLVALMLLIANDLYLKDHYANWLTGKLSDFSGLYVFTQFVATCFGVRIVWSAVVSAVLFAAWKSPLVTPLIELANQHSALQFHRTIDYSDLLALAVLPLAVRFYGGRTTWPWSFLKYPVAALAMLSIMATSTLPRAYSLRTDLRDLSNREGNISATFVEVDKLLTSRAMRCVLCAKESSYREYFDPQGNITTQLNYDNVDKKLFVSVNTYSPDTAKSRTDELQATLMELLRPRFENITVIRAASAYENATSRRSSWKLKIEAPAVGFPLSCAGNGIGHPQIAKAMGLVDELVRLPEAMDLSHQRCRTNDEPCSLKMCREVAFGQVTGPHRLDRSIYLSTRGYVSLRGTSVIVELTELRDARSQGAEFIDKLEKRLRASTNNDITITVVRPDAQAGL
jgi:hypothetical protein